MKEIKDLARNIEEELDDACKYAQLAIDNKTADPSMADTYKELSVEEMEHAMKLHEHVVEKIEKYRKANGDPPERMMGRYEYMHEQYTDKAAKAKGLITVYELK